LNKKKQRERGAKAVEARDPPQFHLLDSAPPPHDTPTREPPPTFPSPLLAATPHAQPNRTPGDATRCRRPTPRVAGLEPAAGRGESARAWLNTGPFLGMQGEFEPPLLL